MQLAARAPEPNQGSQCIGSGMEPAVYAVVGRSWSEVGRSWMEEAIELLAVGCGVEGDVIRAGDEGQPAGGGPVGRVQVGVGLKREAHGIGRPQQTHLSAGQLLDAQPRR